jgi:hypothetical protein
MGEKRLVVFKTIVQRLLLGRIIKIIHSCTIPPRPSGRNLIVKYYVKNTSHVVGHNHTRKIAKANFEIANSFKHDVAYVAMQNYIFKSVMKMLRYNSITDS